VVAVGDEHDGVGIVTEPFHRILDHSVKVVGMLFN
jgi:hypothetical protein